jgi:hypothetical protein
MAFAYLAPLDSDAVDANSTTMMPAAEPATPRST